MANWENEIERVKNDSTLTEKEKENVIGFYQLQIRLETYKKEDMEKKKLKAKTLRLLRKKRNLEKKLKATEKEYTDLLYDDKLFSHHERFTFLQRHDKDKEGD